MGAIMSLDIYFTEPPGESEADRAVALLRANGMHTAAQELQDAHRDDNYWSRNITHNLNKMADAAGIYKHLWRPEEIGIVTAQQLIEPLTAALADLEARPDHYRQFDAENGWGDYSGFVAFVRAVLAAATERPTYLVRASR